MTHTPFLRATAWALGTMGVLHLSGQPGSAPTGPLYQWYFAKQAYFDSIHAFTQDSIFYREGGDYAEFQKFWRLSEPRLSPHGDREVHDQLVRNYEALQAHGAGGSSFRSDDQDPWQEIGPKRRTNAMIGIGPIRSIALDPSDPDNMLCTNYSSGLFYTTNGGDKWNNAGTDVGWAHSGCFGAVYYPGSSSSWYAISAYELWHANALSYVGGVFRTIDAGSEWLPIGDHADFTGPTTETQKLLFDPKVNDLGDHRLFLASTSGLFVSDNPAIAAPEYATWTLATITPTPPSILAAYPNATVDQVVRCYDIEYLPSSTTSTLCASMRFKVTHQVGGNTVTSLVWRFMLSMDDGDSWNEIPNQPQIDETISFATVETSAAAPNAFYCHASKANSWVKVYNVLTGWATTDAASGFAPGFGAGNGFGVDQVNPSSVFVSSGVTMRWYLNGTDQGTMYTGHDDVEDIVGHPTHANEIWVANHGGVYKIDPTASPSWTDRSDNLGVAEVDALSTSETDPGFMVTALYHDNTTLTRTPYAEGWDPDWDRLNIGGDGTRCWTSRQDPNTVYSSFYNGNWKRSDNAVTSNATTDIASAPGQWWSEGAIHRMDADRLFRARKKNSGSYQLFTTDPNGNTITHSGMNKESEIWRSNDRGVTNEYISDFANNIEVNHPAEVVANSFYPHDPEQFWWIRNTPANANHLYVSLINYNWQQRLFRNKSITDPDPNVVKANWEEVPHPRRALLGSGDNEREPGVLSAAFDPEEENSIYIAYSGSQDGNAWDHMGDYAEKMVFKMDLSDIPNDYPTTGKFECGGAHPCSDITMNLPNTTTGLDGLVYEQGSDGGLYISTEAGVYFTDNKRIATYDPADPENADDMANTSGWVRLGDALPHVPGRGLEINYVINRIRIGTFGRGVWEHHLHCPDRLDYAETGTYAADVFLEARNDITSTAELPAGLKVTYRAGNEVHLGAGFHATAGGRFHAFIHPCDVPGNSLHPKSMIAGPDAPKAGPTEAKASLEVFPNPADGSFTVRADFMTAESLATVRLYGPTGNLALSTNMRGVVQSFSVRDLHGLFMLVVEGNGAQRAHKLVLQ